MKKLLSLLLAVGTLFIYSGCNEEEPVMKTGDRVPINFSGIQMLPTKVYGASFIINDSIGIFMTDPGATLAETTIKDKVSNYLYKAVATNVQALFTPAGQDTIYFPVGGSAAFIAYYPAVTSFATNYLIPIDIADQVPISLIPKLDILYSNNASNQIDANVSLVFKHVLSYINFYIEAGAGLTADELQSMSVQINNVATTAQFDLSKDTLTAMGSKTQNIPLPGQYYPSNNAANFEGIFLPGGNGSNSTVTFTLSNGKVFTYAIPATQLYLPGLYYSYYVNLNSTSASITGSVTPWGVGSLPDNGNIVVQ